MLDRAAGDIASRRAEEDAAPDDLPTGAQVGNRTILRPLGSGGTGMVYLAERAGDGYVDMVR